MKNYMHVETGSVDSYENWISCIQPEELADGQTCEQKMDEYIRDNFFVEVVEGATGWIDAEKAVTLDGEIRNLDDIVFYMDDDIRERVHRELAPCKSQDFLDRYCELHKEKFAEDFCIN